MFTRSGTFPIRRARRATLGALIAVVAMATAASPSLAGGFSPTKVLRTAPAGADLEVRDIATFADDIAVVWEEDRAAGRKSFLRISQDGGSTFRSIKKLGAGAQEPQVDVCDRFERFAYVIGTYSTGPETRDVSLHLVHTANGSGGGGQFGRPDDERIARSPDVACVGRVRLAGAWFDESTSPTRVQVQIPSKGEFEPVPHFAANLGRGEVSRGLSVAATPHAVYVTWMRGDEVRFKRFSIGRDADATVTPHPTVTLFENPSAGRLRLAASGDRVALVYQARNDARIRISDDGGLTFSSAQTLIDGPSVGEATAYPTSVDMRGSRILVNGLYRISFPGEIPPDEDITAHTLFSTNGGDTFERSTAMRQGIQIGALVRSGGIQIPAEAWDQSAKVPQPMHQKLRFRTWPP